MPSTSNAPFAEHSFESVENLSHRLCSTVLATEPQPEPEEPAPVQERQPTRIISRILGFGLAEAEPMATPRKSMDLSQTPMPIGCVVIVDGPGRGEAFFLTRLVNRIGRDESQDVSLRFGDDFVSRDCHAVIVYDDEINQFGIVDGKKENPVLLNETVVRRAEKLQSGDTLRVGKTVLRFTAICDAGFVWEDRA